MKLHIERNELLGLLQKVVGVVERKQTLPILGNVLLRSGNGRLQVTATDLEVELITALDSPDGGEPQAITVPGRKFFDICRSLPEGAMVDLDTDGERLRLRSGKARFALATLPADGFPAFEAPPSEQRIVLEGSKLRSALDKSMFAMAQQDVRFYLNGLLLEVEGGFLRAVASDGHRLAYCEQALESGPADAKLVIIPRKGVMELYRLLADWHGDVELIFGGNALRATLGDTVFSVKLVDAKYPDYRRVIPQDLGRVIEVDKEALRQAVGRVAVVCQEKLKGVRFEFAETGLTLSASSPDQEEACDVVDIEYHGAPFETAYNGGYILDALTHCNSEKVRLSVADASTACVVEEPEDGNGRFIVMPLRL